MKKALTFSIVVCLVSWIFTAITYWGDGIIAMAVIVLVFFIYDKFISEENIMSNKMDY